MPLEQEIDDEEDDEEEEEEEAEEDLLTCISIGVARFEADGFKVSS